MKNFKRILPWALAAFPAALVSSAVAASDPARLPDTKVAEIPGYELVWNDEFAVDGAPDPEKWNFEHGFCRNRELQWYRKENATCRGGLLVIEGRKERVKNPRYEEGSGDWKKKRKYAKYTSSSLNTWGKHSWKLSECLIVVRARVTHDQGYFPAIWTTGPGAWPYGGEVDLMECYKGRILGNFVSGNGQRWGTTWHSIENPHHQYRNTPRLEYFREKDPDWEKKFHVWKLIGSETEMRITVDDELVNEVTHEKSKQPPNEWSKVVFPFREHHSLILNLAIGGPGGDPSEASFPMIYEVDYARVYRRR